MNLIYDLPDRSPIQLEDGMEQIPDDVIAKVMKSLENEKFDWRTITGIAKEADVSEYEVRAVISLRDDDIVQSSIPSSAGDALFTTRDRYGSPGKTGPRLLGAFKVRAR